jgi:hypothetical protein
MIYRGPIIWAPVTTPPPPPSHVSKLDRRHKGGLRKRDNLLTGEEGELGRGQIIRQRENLVLYKSFNTLWLQHLLTSSQQQRFTIERVKAERSTLFYLIVQYSHAFWHYFYYFVFFVDEYLGIEPRIVAKLPC